jgi:hypothetical protein
MHGNASVQGRESTLDIQSARERWSLAAKIKTSRDFNTTSLYEVDRVILYVNRNAYSKGRNRPESESFMWCTASRVGTQINVISRRVRKAVNGNVHTNYPQTKIRWANKDQALADDAHIILLFYMFLPMMRLPEILGTVQGCTDYLRVVVPRGGGQPS